MKIEIDYNGSFAQCTITEYVSSESGTLVKRTCPFKYADKMRQIMALDAFRTIEEDYKRNLKLNDNESK